MTRRHIQGFSLLEVGVVLVIIALIIGGVTVGQSMIENSKLRAIAEERGVLVSAATLFQDKYYSLPGDFESAEGLWGTASGACPWGARTDPQTCKGDGNGKVIIGTDTRELFTFWQHLYNADFLDVPYSGIYTTSVYKFTAGTDAPQSQWTASAGWMIQYVGRKSSDATYYDGEYGHIMMLGDVGFDSTENGVMSPIMHKRLDTKFDDGDPDSGKIYAVKGTYTSTSCVSGTAYNVSNDGIGLCSPVWMTGF